jgi:V/A-type H+-transporting ATPase subunit C
VHSEYAYMHARLGALKAELIPHPVWERLLPGGSFAEQRERLERTAYRPHLGSTPESTVQGLRRSLADTVARVARSVPLAARRFIERWARRLLLSDLKTILKGKVLGRSEAQIRSEVLDPESLGDVPLGSLLGASGLEEALELLESTRLSHWIRAARRIHERDPTLFGLHAALDRLYHAELSSEVGRLDPSDRDVVHPIVALEIDSVNLVWLLRYRLNYQLSPAESYYLLVPATGRIASEELKALVRLDSLEEILGRIRTAPYRDRLRGSPSIPAVENGLRRLRTEQARRCLRSAAFTAGEALALLVLKELEIHDIAAVIEGSRLGAPREDIQEQVASA